ncbi:unnamed protein product [Callosobruchus maculatus]|uniref:Peptidase A2 domain-containing protein n=1 Tax=Callosobruchus maculatus TaxID=64391 RepID=A0A653DH91_CALMS|nr:unnamed protein product [Callosobruchus maculatus]
MSRGIASEFQRLFGQVDELKRQGGRVGQVLELRSNQRRLYYLISKEKSYQKPTYRTVWEALLDLREKLLTANVLKLAILRLACGRDGLDWWIIRNMLEVLFSRNIGLLIIIEAIALIIGVDPLVATGHIEIITKRLSEHMRRKQGPRETRKAPRSTGEPIRIYNVDLTLSNFVVKYSEMTGNEAITLLVDTGADTSLFQRNKINRNQIINIAIINKAKGLEELKKKRDEVVDVIYKQEAERSVLEKNISILQEKLEGLNKRLNKDRAIYEQYESTIKETEEGFKKILESSQALLQLAQHETTKLELSSDAMIDTAVSNHTRSPTYGINY